MAYGVRGERTVLDAGRSLHGWPTGKSGRVVKGGISSLTDGLFRPVTVVILFSEFNCGESRCS